MYYIHNKILYFQHCRYIYCTYENMKYLNIYSSILFMYIIQKPMIDLIAMSILMNIMDDYYFIIRFTELTSLVYILYSVSMFTYKFSYQFTRIL